MANVKILSKTVEYGVIRQDPSNAIADAFKALGNDASKSWNDPGVPATNFRRVAYDAGTVVFDPMVTIGQYESTGQKGLHDETAQFFIDKLSGLPTMTFSMPGDQKTLAPHLAGAFQTVAEDVGTPFSKSFTPGGLTGTVDFANNGAPLHTLSMTDKASVDDGIILEDAIINELTLEWDFLANGIARLAGMSGAWVGTELNFEQTMTGTTVETTLTPYNNTESYSFTTFTVDGVDWSAEPFRRFSFTVNNNVTTNNVTTAGKADQYDIKPEYTSTILMDYNDTTEKLLKDYQDGALVVATFASSVTPTLDGGFSIAGVKGQLMSQPFEYNEEFLGVQLDIKWFANAASTPLTVVMTDTQDWGY